MGKPTSLLNLQEFADTFLSSGGGRSNLRILIDMRAHHPDMGDLSNYLAEINAAYDIAVKELPE